jgi:hypothetical protein
LQPQGNPEGEIRFDVGDRGQLTISVFSDHQERLEIISNLINESLFLCLKFDPSAYGTMNQNYRLEDYAKASLSGLIRNSSVDRNMPRLFVLDEARPFGVK